MNLINRVLILIRRIEFLDYEFTVREGHGGVFLQGMYDDKDVYTNAVERQHTRKWLLSPAMTDSEIVQTIFKCALTSFEHRCREAFKYKGKRIFGPHFDVNDLVNLCHEKEAAGGRELPEKH